MKQPPSFIHLSGPKNHSSKSILYTLFLILFLIQGVQAQETNLSELSYSELDSITDIFFHKRNFRGAIAYMEEGKRRAKIEFGDKDSVYCHYLENTGFFYKGSGQFKIAEELFLELVKTRKETLGDLAPGYATALFQLLICLLG